MPTQPTPTFAHHGTLAVTGATGFIGHHVVRQALANGWTVRALVRDYAKADTMLPTDPAEHGGRLALVKGDALDIGALTELTQGAAGVVNCTGIIRETRNGQTFKRMHIGATDALVRAAENNNVGRYVQMSALGVGDEPVCEYLRSKFTAEMRVRASSLAWTILRPSMVHGPKGEFVRMAASMARGKSQPFIILPYFVRVRTDHSVPFWPGNYEEPKVAPIFVGDVARCAVQSMTNDDAVGEIFHLCGPETMPWHTMLESFREHVPNAKRKMPIIGIPADLAAIKAHAMKRIGLGAVLPFDAGMATMASQDNVCDMTKASQVFGDSFADFRTTFARYAGSIDTAG